MQISVELLPYSEETRSPALEMRAEQNDVDKAKNAGQRVQFNHNRVIFQLDNAEVFHQTHPDLIALACLMAYRPFISRELTLNFAVSAEFAWLVEKYQKISIGPTSPHLVRRYTDDSYKNAVSFSGGVDSCVALDLMPDNTIPVFLRRLRPEGEPMGLYRDGGAMASCEAVRNSGREAYAFYSSVEYSRNSVGFSVDWTASTPIILHADFFKVRSIAFGMIMEAAFSLGRVKYEDLGAKSVYKQWKDIFDYVGLSICLPTCGLSEVITSRIALEKLSGWLPSSCVRVVGNEPCRKCFKCFRKKITDVGLTFSALPQHYLDLPYQQKGVANEICAEPIHLENVMAYSMARIPHSDHPIYQGLLRKTDAIRQYGQGLAFLERYYPPSLDFVPDFLRTHLKESIEKYCQPMSEQEVVLFQSWNTEDLPSQPSYREGHNMLLTTLGRTEEKKTNAAHGA